MEAETREKARRPRSSSWTGSTGKGCRRRTTRRCRGRKVYIAKEDLETHGYTAKCPGCTSILRGTTRQAHSEACRRRMEEELKGTEKARRAKKRIGEYTDRKMAEEEEKRKRKTEDKKAEGEQHERDADAVKPMDGEAEKPADAEAEKPMDVEAEKGKRRREGEDEDEATEKNTLKWLRKMEREDWRKRRGEIDKEDEDMGEVDEAEEDRLDRLDDFTSA